MNSHNTDKYGFPYKWVQRAAGARKREQFTAREAKNVFTKAEISELSLEG